MKISQRARNKGAKARKHGCARCHKHKSKIVTLQKKGGRRYTLCTDCAAQVRP